MATTLFLRNTAETGLTISGNVIYKLATTRGSSVSFNFIVSAVASGNHLQIVSNFDGSVATIWAYRVNAVTISSTVSFNFWGSESLMTTNAGFAAIVSRYDNGGNFISDVVAQANANHADGVELGTSAAAMSWTATPTSTSFSDGDWLTILVHADAVGTMGTGTVGVDVGGPTSAADGDTFVTFTETITAFTAAADQPYRNPMIQLLAH
jgi:hypothetical protein